MKFKYLFIYCFAICLCALSTDSVSLKENKNLEELCVSLVNKSAEPLLDYIKQLNDEIKLNKLENKDQKFSKLQMDAQKYQLTIAENSHLDQLLEFCTHNIESKEELITSYKARIADLTEIQPETTMQNKEANAKSLALIEQQNKQIIKQHEIIEKHLSDITKLKIRLEHSVIKESYSKNDTNPNQIQGVTLATGFACVEKSENSWTIVQQKKTHYVYFNDFNRDWKDFGKGFGYANGNFFIGLDALHKLTDAVPHELLLIMVDFDNQLTYALYDDFKIGDEESKYQLTSLGKFCGNATDIMNLSLEQKFSTIDVDNDLVNRFSCAVFFNSAWWYGSCLENHLASNPANFYPKHQMLIRPKM